MTTLRSMASIIKDRLSGGDATIDSQLDVRDIAIRIREKMNELIKLSFFENMKMGDRNSISLYVATYTGVEVKTDETQKYKYCDLPDNFMLMPHNKGIHSIAPTNDSIIQLVRHNNPYVSQHLRVAHMETLGGYYLEGNRIVFKKKNFDNTKWKKFNIKLIVAAPEVYGLDDPLPLYIDQRSMIIEQLTQFYSQPVIHDSLNDGNKDIGVNTNG